ncbi:MAG: 50S ribosomal protein L27 [bacterium]
MAHVKAGGTAKNLRDSKPKMLGVKIYGNQAIKTGQIIIRQRGQKYHPGENVSLGKDHTIFAMKDGKVKFQTRRVLHNGGTIKHAMFVSVV